MLKTSFISCLALCGLVACSTKDNQVDVLIGTHTDEGSEGIYTLKVDQEKGTWKLVTVSKSANPSYFAQLPGTSTIFVSNQNKTPEDAVERYSYDPATGAMTAHEAQLTATIGPCYVSTNGKLVLAANYAGGSLDVFKLDSEGKLLPCSQVFKGTASGPVKPNQEVPHVHCAVFTPDGKYALATDFSADRIMHFKVGEEGLEPLASHPYTEVKPGSGPRHILFSNDGKMVYVISELSGEVTVFSYHDGILETKQVIMADEQVGAAGSADIHMSPDGKFLYTSHRLQGEGISVFKVDRKSGLLTRIGFQPSEEHPRHFNMTPNGKYILCACRNGNAVQIFKRNPRTGLLTDTGEVFKVSHPICVYFPQ